MFRNAIILLILLFCVASLACQSYTTGLQQSVERADETAATGALHTIALAEQTYSASHEGAFGTFQQLSEAGYLDERFSSSQPTVKDYVLTIEVRPKTEDTAEAFYSCKADPARPQLQGRHFYIDSTSSALHVSPNAPATANDPIAQP